MSFDKFDGYLFNISNPIYYAIVFTLIIISLIYLFYKYIVIPNQQKYILKLKEVELKNVKLLALFSELDPNPVLRINLKGEIIQTNGIASKIFKIQNNGTLINDFLPSLNFPVAQYISQNKSQLFYENIDDKYYSILFKGISHLNIAQLYFNDLTDRKLYEERLKVSENLLRNLLMNHQEKIEEERQKIARELHDDLGQNLLFIKLSLERFQKTLKKDMGTTVYNEFISLFDNTINNLKSILYEIKPKVLEELGLKTAINSLCQKINKDTILKGEVNIVGFNNKLNSVYELTIYRIIQEAMSNIIKHSMASTFAVNLIEEKDKVILLISDNGKGIDDAEFYINNKLPGMGLSGIKERVENYSGILKVESSPNEGTQLLIEIPKKGRRNG